MTVRSDARLLADVLREGTFAIPRHQRAYDWGVTHVEDFLSDISRCIADKKKPDYFLGAVMLVETETAEENEWVVNDGQQRMVTYSLLCAQLCRRFHAARYTHGENSMMKVIFDYSQSTVSLDDAEGLKVRINLMDQGERNTYGVLMANGDINRNGKILTAWQKIESELLQKDDAWLRKLMTFLLEKLRVIVVSVSKDEDVNAIFEALNGRGKQLEQIHLLRNHIYSYFSSDSSGEKAVEEELRKLSLLMPEDKIERYAHCIMQAKYGHIPARRLYRGFRAQIDERFDSDADKKKEVLSFVKQLGEDLRIGIFNVVAGHTAYAGSVVLTRLGKDAQRDVKNQQTELLEQLTKDARQGRRSRKIEDYIRDVKDYSVCHPVMFALLCRYLDAKTRHTDVAKFVYKASQYLSSFIQRTSHVVGSFSPSHYDKEFAALARDVSSKKCKTPDAFLSALESADKEGIMNNRAYIERMKTTSFKKQAGKVKYILARVVERSGQDVREQTCTVEHILPQSKDYLPGWKFFDEDLHEQYVHRLGNLTLLKENENRPRREDNESFSAKRKIYSKSGYNLTLGISEYDAWSPAEINARQHDLAKILATIWNFDR